MTKFLKINNHSTINVDEVSNMYIDYGHGSTSLHITMKNGNTFYVEHNPWYMGGNNVYDIEKEIIKLGNG